MSIRSYIEATPARKALYQLTSGNALVFILQVIGLFITLTYYSKYALSVYTLFVTLSYLSTKLTTLRLPEFLIREPNKEKVLDGANAILTLSLILTTITVAIFLLLSLFGIDFQLFKSHNFSLLFPLFAVGLLVASLNQLWSTLLLKSDQTKQISTSRILKSLIQLIVMVLLITRSEYGLIIAWVAGLIIEFIYLILTLKAYQLRLTSLSAILEMIKENRDIIYYTLPISLLLSIHDNIIVQSIEYFYGPAVLAVFAVVDRVLRIPSQIIGGAASQVLYKYGSDSFHDSKTNYSRQFFRGLSRISLVFIACAIGCMLLAKPVFEFVFQENWTGASHYIIKYAWWIIPFSLMALLRNVPVMLKRQKQYFFLELSLVISIGVGLYFAGNNLPIETYYWIKYGIELIFYVIMIWSVISMVRRKTKTKVE